MRKKCEDSSVFEGSSAGVVFAREKEIIDYYAETSDVIIRHSIIKDQSIEQNDLLSMMETVNPIETIKEGALINAEFRKR